MNARHERQTELVNALLAEVEIRNIQFDEAVVALSSALMLYIQLMVPSHDMRQALTDTVLRAMRGTVDEIEQRRAHGGDLWRPKP